MSEAAAQRGPILGWLLGALVLAFVAWRVVVLATDPGLQPDATLERAQAAMKEGRTEDAARLARVALAERPLDGRPYALLAQIAHASGDTAEAARLAGLAVKHAPREPLARALAAQVAMTASDWPNAVRHYDHLLRVTPDFSADVFPVLAALAQAEETRPALAARLAEGPPWRSAFLREFARTAPDPRLLFRDAVLKDGLSPEEAGAYVNRYIADRRWADAFVAWAGLLSPESLARLTTPMDGSFEPPLTGGPPFSWEIRAPRGIEAGLWQRPGEEGTALRVQFLGRRSAFNHVRQLLVLPVGHYVLTWRQRLENLQTARGLRWTVTCADGTRTRIIATDAEAGTSSWEDRAAAFSVPEDCPAQWLVLELEARIPAETLAAGSAWFDDVRVQTATEG